MKRAFFAILFTLFYSLAAFCRDDSILKGRATIIEGKKYPKGVIPADATLVIPPVLGITMFEDMNPTDRQRFANAFSQDPETASLVVAAQIGVYCWQRASIEDQSRSEYFIASSLYNLWIHTNSTDHMPDLLWYDEAENEAHFFDVGHLLDAFTFQYGSSAKEIEIWLNNVARKISDRNVWAIIAVEEILHKKEIYIADLGHLAKITRNVYVYETRDIEAFKKWWKRMRERPRRDWAIDLVDRSIRILTGKQPAARIEAEAAFYQLPKLLPEDIWVKTLGQPVPTTDREKRLEEALDELESWWQSHKKEYRVPLDSSLAL